MPNVLDDNVVILRFDNSDFEKNTEKSIESLERLKKSASESGSEKGLENLGKAAKNIDLSRLDKNVEGLHKRFGLLGTIGSAAIGNLTNKAVDATTRIATAIPRQIVEGGWKRALNIEQAKFQIEGLKQIWDETSEGYKEGMKTVKASVLDAVNGTAFGLDEAAKVASQFAASGMKAGDDMTDALKGISGVAAMTGSSFEDIGRIFTTVAGNGRLMGDQLLQLSGRGINAAATLADSMNKSETEIREMVSKGEISFEQFYRAMNKAFGEHAKKANDTYTGSLANMKAALSRIGADIETTKLENMRHIFNALTPVIDKVHVLLGGFINAINGASTAVSNFAVRGINSINKGLEPYVNAIEKAKEEAAKLAEKEKEAGDGAKDGAKKTEEATETFKPIVKIIRGIAKGVLAVKDAFDGVGVFIKSFARQGRKGLKPMLSTIGDGLYKLGGKAQKAAGKFKGFIKEVDAYSKIASKGKIASDELEKLSKKGIDAYGALAKYLNVSEQEVHRMVEQGRIDFKTFYKAMMEAYGKKPIGTVLKFVRDFRNSHKQIDNYISRFKNSFGKLKDSIKDTKGFEKLQKVSKLIGKSIANIASSGLNALVDKFEILFKIAKKMDILGGITNFFDSSASKIADFIKNTANGIKPTEAFLKMFHTLGGKLSKVDIGNYFRNLAGYKIDTKLTAASSKVMSGLVKGADALQTAHIPEKLGKTAEGVKHLTNAIAQSNVKVKVGNAKEGIIGFIKSLDINKMSDTALKITKIVALIKVLRDLGNVANATVGMLGSIGGFFRSLTGLTGTLRKSIKIEMFRTIAMSIAMLAGSVAILAMIPKDRFKPAMAGLTALMTLMVGIVALTTTKNFDPIKMKAVGVAFAGMGAAMLALSASVEKLSKIKPTDLAKAGIAITGFIAIFMASSHMAKDIQKSGKSFLAMAAAVDALVFAVTALAALSFDTLMEGGAAILFLVTELAIANKIAGKEGKAAGLLGMALAMDLLIPPLIVLGLLPTEQIKKAAIAIGAVMMEIAVAARIASSSKGEAKTMILMATMVGTLATSLAVLSFLNPAKLLIAAGSLAGSIHVIVTELIAAAKANIKTSAILLSTTIAIMTAAVVTLIKMDIKKSLAAVAGLGALTFGLAKALAVFEAMTPVGVLEALGGLAIAVSGLIALMAIIGGISELGDGFIGKKIDAFGDLLEKIGNAFGKFAGGFMTGLSGSLKQTAKDLTDFMVEIQPFIELSKDIKGNEFKGVMTLASTMKELSKAELMDGISGIAAMFGGGEESGSIADKMNAMADGFIEFSNKVKEIPDDTVNNVQKISNIINTLATAFSTIPREGGAIDIFRGWTDVDWFSEGIVKIAKVFSDSGDGLGGITIDPELTGKNGQIAKIAEIIKTLSEAASSIPPTLGVKQFLVGHQDLALFGAELASFASNFDSFKNTISSVSIPPEFLEENGKLDRLCQVIVIMAETSKKLPTMGGFKSVVFGEKDLESFSDMLADSAKDIKKFIEKLQGFEVTQEDADKVAKVASMVAAMGEASQKLPDSGASFKRVIFGKKDVSNFAEQLAEAIPSLQTFVQEVKKVKNLNEKDLSKATQVAKAIKIMAQAAKALPNSEGGFQKLAGEEDIGKFGKQLANLMKSLKGMGKVNIDADNIKNAASALKKITPMLEDLKAITPIPKGTNLPTLGSNVASFVSSLGNVETKGIASKAAAVKTAVKKLGNAANAGAKSLGNADNFATAGSSLGSGFAKGLKSSNSTVKKAAKNLGDKAVNGARENRKPMEKGGEYVGQGFVKGIKSKWDEAYRAGYKLGQKANQGEKDATKHNSPSKVAIAIGKGVGEGLVIGMKSFENKVYKSGYDIGLQSVEGANDGFANLSDDLSSPVITPVIDMSGVEYGFAKIDNAFSRRQAMAIDPNVETSDMRVRNSLNKAISAINGMGNSRPNVINNSITVDGSENPEAFAQRFVRQIELEMRTG